MSEDIKDIETKCQTASEPAAALTYGMSAEFYNELAHGEQPYTMAELNARIDETEAEIDRGEGKSFEEMMNGFKKELLWLK